MKRKTKLKSEIQELSEFIRDHMLTRSEFKEEMEKIEAVLDDHTKRLSTIEGDTKQGLDKRILLESRVLIIERQLGISSH